MFRKLFVKKDERALLFRKGDFVELLAPGEHYRFDPLGQLTMERFSLAQTRFEHRLASYLLRAEPELVAQHFHMVELGPAELALRYENGVLVELIAPNTRALYWKGYIEIRVERVDIATQYEVAPQVARLLASAGRNAAKIAGLDGVYALQVPAYHAAVLFVDGKVERVLDPGAHAFYRYHRELRAELVDLRLQALEVGGQEILTKDKVALRVNLGAGYRVSDVLTAFAKQAKPVEFLYKELQFGLRAAIGTRTLDELLENKSVIDEVVGAQARRALEGYGLTLDSVGVKDLILPGDMKTILTKVVEAEKSAQANVIRRREETAATRSLLNTAKVMEDNPVALRLKELETLERVTEKIDKISVFGGLEGVLKDLVRIAP